MNICLELLCCNAAIISNFLLKHVEFWSLLQHSCNGNSPLLTCKNPCNEIRLNSELQTTVSPFQSFSVFIAGLMISIRFRNFPSNLSRHSLFSGIFHFHPTETCTISRVFQSFIITIMTTVTHTTEYKILAYYMII